MPPKRPRSALMRMVDSDLEDELSDISLAIQPKVAATPAMPVKKARGRPPKAASKITKSTPQSTSHRASGRLAAAVAAEIDATPQASPEPADPQPKARGRGKTTTKDAPAAVEEPRAARGRPRAAGALSKTANTKAGNKDESPPSPGPENPAAKPRGRPRRKAATPVEEIPETQQPEAMDVDEDDKDELDVLSPQLPSALTPTSTRGAIPSSVRSLRMVDSDARDPSLRRKLGDLSKRYETLEAKYRQLLEIGTREAERNFDNFRKLADERAQSASTPTFQHSQDLAIC
jgi:hypothetical protein